MDDDLDRSRGVLEELWVHNHRDLIRPRAPSPLSIVWDGIEWAGTSTPSISKPSYLRRAAAYLAVCSSAICGGPCGQYVSVSAVRSRSEVTDEWGAWGCAGALAMCDSERRAYTLPASFVVRGAHQLSVRDTPQVVVERTRRRAIQRLLRLAEQQKLCL